MAYYIETTSKQSFDKTIETTVAALAEAGFGVLSEIDVAATLKKKLNLDKPPYRILGACNPNFAHQALDMEHNLGVLLPCNVIVRQETDGSVKVAAVDPLVQLSKTGNAALEPVAAQVRTLLQGVIDKVGKA
ncbi:MAG: DUF302 domain-containing protein [Quisquiliibacterium sp.]|jgi:uncharacterized protein (DUF302 family)